MVASLVVGEKYLAAAGDPFDRTPDALRRPQDQRVLGIGKVLGAKAAADVGGDEAYPIGGDVERARRKVAIGVNVLAGDVQREASPSPSGRDCRPASSRRTMPRS